MVPSNHLINTTESKDSSDSAMALHNIISQLSFFVFLAVYITAAMPTSRNAEENTEENVIFFKRLMATTILSRDYLQNISHPNPGCNYTLLGCEVIAFHLLTQKVNDSLVSKRMQSNRST